MKTSKLAAMTLFILMTAPATQAESDSERFTLLLMDTQDPLFAEQDYYPIEGNDMTGSLKDFETTHHTRHFVHGNSYAIGAVCDEDCTDIDIWVYDKYGNEVASDDDDSDLAVADFRATYNGEYKIEIKMFDCQASYCYYRIRTYE